MAINKLYISHNNFDFSSFDSKWLTKDNIDIAINSKSIQNYHSTIEDLNIKSDQILWLFDKVKEIILLDCNNLLKNNITTNLKIAYHLLTDYNHLYKGDLQNLRKILITSQFLNKSYVNTTNLTDSNQQKLWIAGCSLSSASPAGEISGLPYEFVEPNERWGHLVSKKLNRFEMNLAKGGSSILDSFRQIIDSDINVKNDILVWQLTSLSRLNLIDQNGIYRSVSNDFKYIKKIFGSEKYIVSDHQILGSLINIHMGINYCKKMKINLYVVNLLADSKWLLPLFEFHHDIKFLDLYPIIKRGFLDLGFDQEHPGPKQNAEYAKEIIKFIQGT